MTADILAIYGQTLGRITRRVGIVGGALTMLESARSLAGAMSKRPVGGVGRYGLVARDSAILENLY